jgi:chemotaxis protein MotB
MADDDKDRPLDNDRAPEPEDHAPDAPPDGPRQAGVTVVTTLVLAIACASAGGLGYYAYALRGKSGAAELARDEARAKADGAKADLAACAKERDLHKAGREGTEKAAADAQATLSATRAELEDLRRERAETEARLAAFKSIATKFQKMIDTGKLKVLIRNGRMIVKLPAEIFFASGKAELTSEAAPALREIAGILRTFADRRFEVAGHTDSLPLHNEAFKSNWELSTARAVTVTEALIGGGMNPANLVAAGYGPYDPVANNTSEAGRKENRRIEIVLLPNIKELPALPAEAPAASASAGPAAGEANAAPEAPAVSAAPAASIAPGKAPTPAKSPRGHAP